MDQLRIKFNVLVSRNKSSRQKLESIKSEKSIFVQSYDRLVGRLSQIKGKIESQIQIADLALQERDRVGALIESIKQRFFQSDQLFEEQLKSLAQKQGRNERNLNETNENLTSDAPKIVMKIDQGKMEDNLDKRSLQQEETQKIIEQYRSLEGDFNKLKITTKLDSFERLVDQLRKIEEQNFREFKLTNQLS